MRHLALWRLVATLLLAALPLATPALAPAGPVALADNGNGNASQGNNGDHDKGHGNDPDGVDEDNPGKSKGAKDKDKKDTPVEAIPAGYVVDVTCEADAGATTCTFAATAPEGGKKVDVLEVPAAALCADVTATDAKYADPEPHTHIAGYTSTGEDKTTLALTFDGAVTTGGTTTYWIKAASAVFPVTGPGVQCDLAASDATVTAQFNVTPTATEAPATGTVVVAVLACAGVPADTTDFDWFGQCQPGGEQPRQFTLAPSGGEPVAATTDASGTATFAELAPGNYRLDLVDGSWCHAVSDRVTTDSEVMVEAGATSTVWIFTCDQPRGA